MKKQNKHILWGVLAGILIIITCISAYAYYIINTNSNLEKTAYIYIDENKDYNSILLQLDTTAHISHLNDFKILANILDYPENIKTGRYAISKNMNLLDIVRSLKNGQQTPVKFTFNNIRTKDDLAGRISQQLMITDAQILLALNDSVKCSTYGFSKENIGCMFIPDTYELYWDTKLDKFLSRMQYEYKVFWTEKRKQKALDLNLSPIEVSILASIVEEECYFSDEYPIVAGLYLNRLRKGMKLQADPTIKFAVNDFSIRRVLNRHLDQAKSSPYSTYEHTGLPPGPIRIPSIKAIDAVLSPASHNYIFMCAKDDFSGRHNFAVTGAEHERNRQLYHTALNKRKIFQ